MKTRVIVAVVVMIHCVAVGTLLMQGCRSTGESMAPARQDIGAAPETSYPMTDDVPVVESPVVEAESTPAPIVEPVQLETTAYVIRKGDTLGAIAKHYDVRVGDIMALNGLENANKIRVGQKIELPGIHNVSSLPPVVRSAPRASKQTSSSSSSSSAVAADGQGYTIKKGDSLSTIAKSHGVSVKALKEANNLSSDRITAGKKLVIPGSSAVASADPVAPTGLVDPTVAPVVDPTVAPVADPTATPTLGADVTNTTVAMPDTIDTSDLDIEGAATTQPADSTALVVAPVDPIAPMPEGDYKMHTVSADEDLSTIAIRWGVTEESIRTLNALGSDTLSEGQVLKIPAH